MSKKSSVMNFLNSEVVNIPFQPVWQYIYSLGLFVTISVGMVFLGHNYQVQRNREAQDAMYQAVYHFEAGEFVQALQGDEIHVGLLDIVTTYRFTKAANLARFYVGASYIHQKDYAKAIPYLKRFSTRSALLRARAWVLIGDAYIATQNASQAASYYLRASRCKPNAVFTPIYLQKAAEAFEVDHAYTNALNCYIRLEKEFADTIQGKEAQKHVSRLRTKKV